MIKTEYRVQGSADITIAVVADLHERKPDQVLEIIGLTFVGTKILIGGFLFSAEEKQKWRMMYNGVCK